MLNNLAEGYMRIVCPLPHQLCSAFLIRPELGLITEDHVLKPRATACPLTGQMNSHGEKLEGIG